MFYPAQERHLLALGHGFLSQRLEKFPHSHVDERAMGKVALMAGGAGRQRTWRPCASAAGCGLTKKLNSRVEGVKR